MPLLDITQKLNEHSVFSLEKLADCAELSKIFKGQFIPLANDCGLQRREVTLRGHTFVEVITHLSPQKLHYQIEGHGPIKAHRGIVSLTRVHNQLHLRYQIYGRSNTWLPTWLLKLVLFIDFKLAIKRLRKLYHVS